MVYLNLGEAVQFCDTHGGHDMKSGPGWGTEQEPVRKFVCTVCGRELVAVGGDVSGSALYTDCDRVTWRKVSVLEALDALDEGTMLRTVNGDLYTIFPLPGRSGTIHRAQ